MKVYFILKLNYQVIDETTTEVLRRVQPLGDQ